ncbi:MAG: histidine kinase [Burkholderiales bacterium]|nr:histidine kinase [Burkholderiales bacterium]
MSRPEPPDPAAPADLASTLSRPASLWPETTRPAPLPSTGFAASRFDPLAEERARLKVQAAAAFDVCHPALALRAVLLVQLLLMIVALGSGGGTAQWLAHQAALAFAGAAGTLLWLVAVCALQRPLQRAEPVRRAGAVLLLGAAAAVLGWLPLVWAGLAGATDLRRTAAVALAGAAFAALLWAWLDLRARIWHPANASARLAELQSRIRPHFLFNALNTALALVRVDPERAENVLEDLAQLFRVALAEVGAAVTLDEEIELARRYLAIEQVRFGPRLEVQWRVEPGVGGARVPPLVLQPLVENAVRHGIEPAAQGGRVIVRVQRLRGQAVVVVSNTLAAGDEAPLNPGHGMALHNVRERLRLLHDVAAQCDVWREGAMFHARLVVPAE